MPGHGSLGGQGGRLRLGAERFTCVVCPKAVPEVLTPQPPQGQHDQTGKGFTEETQVSQVQRPGRSDPSAGEEEDLQREAAAAWQRCRALNYIHGLVIFRTAPGGLLSRPGYRPPPEPRGRYSVRPRPRAERQPVLGGWVSRPAWVRAVQGWLGALGKPGPSSSQKTRCSASPVRQVVRGRSVCRSCAPVGMIFIR